MSNRRKICFVVAVPGTAQAFLKDHIKALSATYDVYVAYNNQSGVLNDLEGVIDEFHFPIQRSISLGADLKSVRVLTDYFKRMKFDAVHSVTPKAALVCALAARMAGIKHRTHTFTGQVWATRKGPMRWLLKGMDRLIATLDNHLLVDGKSQRQFLIDEGVLKESNSAVLGAGSICGANTERFSPSLKVRESQRRELGISEDKMVFAFMGRLNREKGIYELLEAFNSIAFKYPNAYLLIFGFDEEGCMDHLSEYPNIKSGQNFKYAGMTSTPHLSLQTGDVFCLPSYREGFGMSVVEAQSLGLPAICSDAYGLADTIAEGETGLRCKVQDSQSLADAMVWMLENPGQAKEMGKKGRERVLANFTGEKIVGEWVKFYNGILG